MSAKEDNHLCKWCSEQNDNPLALKMSCIDMHRLLTYFADKETHVEYRSRLSHCLKRSEEHEQGLKETLNDLIKSDFGKRNPLEFAKDIANLYKALMATEEIKRKIHACLEQRE